MKLKESVRGDGYPMPDGYEIPKGLTRIAEPFRMAGVWFVSQFPALGKFLFVEHSHRGRKVRKYAATHKALELVYTYTWDGNGRYGLAEQILTHILFNFKNAKALRNRLRLVNKGLKQLILDSIGIPDTIISLGSGSARDLVEVVAELRSELKDYCPRILLVDRSRNALRYSEAMIREHKVGDVADWILVHAKIEDFIQDTQEKADIVLMIGIMDYLKDKKAVEIVSRIYSILRPGGTLFTSNIVHNGEKRFLDCVLDWPMIYRGGKELEELMSNSGFEKENFRIVYEPLGIHGVIVARK